MLGTLGALVAAPALAADPVPGARYAGQTTQGKLRFEFRVSADGTQVERLFTQFRAPHCEDAKSRAQGSLRPGLIAVREGTFAKRGKEVERLKPQGRFEGGKQIERYSIEGRFATPEEATGSLEVTVEVRDADGETISTCEHRRPITWSADRLGVGPETEE